MNRKILFLGFFSFILVNGVWIWKYHQSVQELASRVGDARIRLERTFDEYSFLSKTWKTGMESNAGSLDGSLTLWSMDGRSSPLKQLLSDDKKLILLLSDSNCSSCVEKLLFLLNREKFADLADHLLVLYSAEDETIKIWSQRQQILCRAQFFRVQEIGVKMHLDLNYPVFFLSGPDLVAEHYYTIYPALDNLTEDYLTVIAKRYF